MITVDIRELEDRLHELLRRVRAGESILVTDGGAVVAELRPPRRLAGAQDLPPALAELVRAGHATPGAPNDPALYPALEPLLSPGELRELLDEERGER